MTTMTLATQAISIQLDDILVARQEAWNDKLDMMGTNASTTEYEKHLLIAPDPDAPMVNYLAGFLAGSQTNPF